MMAASAAKKPWWKFWANSKQGPRVAASCPAAPQGTAVCFYVTQGRHATETRRLVRPPHLFPHLPYRVLLA
jgi:hypothetical protein